MRVRTNTALLVLGFLLTFASAAAESDSDLAGAADHLVREQLRRAGAPGAVLVVAEGDAIALARGYGVADPASGRRVHPAQTVFEVGSISKLFTCTAALQFAEQGALDLDASLRTLLPDLRLSLPHGEITAAHLMTHTAGFEYRAIGAFRRGRPLDLGRYLTEHMPPQIRAPGTLLMYSDQGTYLLGHLVAELSRVAFPDYVERHILEPLGMQHSSFRYDYARARRALGHVVRAGEATPAPILPSASPAGGLKATGEDMGRFLLAQLNGGANAEGRILEPAMLDRMHARQFAHHPLLPGVAFGFFESFANDTRALWHDGYRPGTSSLLYLVPEERFGVFVSNNGGSHAFNWAVVGGLLARRLAPGDVSPAQPTELRPSAPAADLAGSYRSVRYSRSTIEKVMTLFAQLEVRAAPDGRLEIPIPGFAYPDARWEQVAPLLFRSRDPGPRGLPLHPAAFRRDESERVSHLLLGPIAFERLLWWEAAAVQLGAFALLVLLFASSLAGAGRRLLRGARGPAFPSLARSVELAVCAGNLVFVVGSVATLAEVLSGGGVEFAYGLPRQIVVLSFVPIATAVLCLPLVACAALAWSRSWGSLAARVHYSLVAAAAALFVPLLAYWNLLGLRA
jgi:CubicO group peptidase (beta-lactamase class C family)